MIVKNANEKTEDNEKNEESSKIIMLGGADTDIRTVAVYGDITEELAKEAVGALWYLRSTAKIEKPIDIDDPETEYEEEIQPLEMVISTNGGSADDMFAIYDVMRICREELEIETLGIGKVMSAGVLLLAAGTKGKRRVGKHCRVMIHSVIGGHIGPMHQLDNEMKEVKAIQESYIKALCDETHLTEKQLRALLRKKVNIYLTAEETVKYGIADIIV
jgi:ATP-dependent Clp endopeptidase proteolytic subunit ClpP